MIGAFRLCVACLLGPLVLVGGMQAANAAEPAEPAVRRAPSQATAPSWGAIAARPGDYGYSFNQPSRATAERLARAQCDRAAGSPGARRAQAAQTAQAACEVRAYFDRSCGALATGNFGEWGTALGASKEAAGKAAVAECNGHLPTEPCKLSVSVCSLP